MPLIVPAVEASTLIVAAFGAAAGCSGPEGDLLQPSATSSANKIVGTKERIEMAFIFSFSAGLTLRITGDAGIPYPLP